MSTPPHTTKTFRGKKTTPPPRIAPLSALTTPLSPLSTHPTDFQALYEKVKKDIHAPKFFNIPQNYKRIEKIMTNTSNILPNIFPNIFPNIYEDIALPFLIRVAILHPNLEDFETRFPKVYHIIRSVQETKPSQKKIGQSLLRDRNTPPQQKLCLQQTLRKNQCTNRKCRFKHETEIKIPCPAQRQHKSCRDPECPSHHVWPTSPPPPPPGFKPPSPLLYLTQKQRKTWYPPSP